MEPLKIGVLWAMMLLFCFCIGLTPSIIDYSNSINYESWTFTGHTLLAGIMSNFGLIWIGILILVPVGYLVSKEVF